MLYFYSPWFPHCHYLIPYHYHRGYTTGWNNRRTEGDLFNFCRHPSETKDHNYSVCVTFLSQFQNPHPLLSFRCLNL